MCAVVVVVVVVVVVIVIIVILICQHSHTSLLLSIKDARTDTNQGRSQGGLWRVLQRKKRGSGVPPQENVYFKVGQPPIFLILAFHTLRTVYNIQHLFG